MAPVACLDISPGDKVLDLCAAPGGKSTQIASRLKGKGLLLSNDNSPDRVKALAWNLEHWGVQNAVVTNEEPQRLALLFPGYFDKILVDAPCSGEGMFRKDEKAAKNWSECGNMLYAGIQKEILAAAASMLKPGGRIVYSTCTFSAGENEGVVVHFLKEHPDFSLVELPGSFGWDSGRPDWLSGETAEELKKTKRSWPHKTKGEGHFMALLHKKETSAVGFSLVQEPAVEAEIKPLLSFMDENLTKPLEGLFISKGNYVYCCPRHLPSLAELKILRHGWFLGIIRNNRFEPSQALAMGLQKEDVKRTLSLAIDEINVERYLKCETLMLEGEKGWTLVCLEEFPLGWGKQTGNYLKNQYPSRWRLLE